MTGTFTSTLSIGPAFSVERVHINKYRVTSLPTGYTIYLNAEQVRENIERGHWIPA